MVSTIQRRYIAPMDRLEVVSIIAEDLCCEAPLTGMENRDLAFQRDRYRCALLRAVRWLCAKTVHDPEFRELWAMIGLAEAAEITREHFPLKRPVAAQALAFAWAHGGDCVTMTTSSHVRIMSVLSDLENASCGNMV